MQGLSRYGSVSVATRFGMYGQALLEEGCAYAHPSFAGIGQPDGFNGFLLAEAPGLSGAFRIGEVPVHSPFSRNHGTVGEHAPARHFQEAGTIVLFEPLPGVLQPLIAVCLGLLREPRN